ncbi:MAG TPA: cobalamin-independent methionine synthase II family protein [Dehalococcoidia bacterium]|nr:cobalamin-independent methionine synthase II family protein [Dehalococcoidia bacterium]
MKRSTDRILTSHAGSLHGPEALRDLLNNQPQGQPFDAATAASVKSAVADVVRLQAENGVDVVNDGEYTKGILIGWMTYAQGRLEGLERRQLKPGEDTGSASIFAREAMYFGDYFKQAFAGFGNMGSFGREAIYCTGPLVYKGQADAQRDIEYMKAAMQATKVEEGFLTALAPGTIEHWLRNEHYKSDEEFLFALADAMHDEYKAITDAGLVVQIDDPDLPDGFQCYPQLDVPAYRKFADLRVEALNHALRDCPEDLVRLHICWGSFHHPHTQDIPLRDLIDIVFKVKAQCYSIEAANPQHEHDWQLFEDVKLPDGKIIMPGVLGHCAPEFVEHRELVAQRLIRYANLVGRENVIAGTDCGLSRVAHASIQWAKFRAMAEGARIASAKLWRK